MNGRHVFQISGGWAPRGAALPLAALPLAALALAALASSARASPPEVFSELALDPTDAGRLVLAYAGGGQGLLFSDDGGHHLRLRCGTALGAELPRSRLPLALTHDGQALLGTFGGLWRGGADGCGFAAAPELSGVQVADIVPHPRDARVLFVAVVEGERGRVLRREPDGSLNELSPRETPDAGAAALRIDRLRVAALGAGGLRLYTSGLRAELDGRYTSVLRRSDDDGASWTTLELPDEEGARLLLVAVDPTNPDRLALSRERDDARDELLISADGGATFAPVLDVHQLGAIALAPDGRLWVGDAGGDAEYSQPGGLYLLDDFAAPARALATWPVRCLGYQPLDGALLGCTRSELGTVDPATGAFTTLSAFQSVGAFVSCGDEDLAASCERQLCDNWCGVLHYAQAPLCDAYHGDNPVCGPAARGYGSSAAMAGPASDGSVGVVDSEAVPGPVTSVPRPAAPAPAAASCALDRGRRALSSATLGALLALAFRARRRRARATRATQASLASCKSHRSSCHASRVQRHS